ncbi:AAA family ATPase [Massilia sp. PAMC28688]|uniref:ATPase domain-containing protein n=1 Tax=Massilia sp. PAMC28688 TaxID=2861283 RepID=UPI001C62B082|nr:ATPase domain-containing protein [Massilia sp. PAMC28688]QYF92075.1 AAA family ATPase [Massilia sp. PAMC28688]
MDTILKTGITGLDEVLRGGLPRQNNLMVEGAPGSGKTTLGLGFIYAGAEQCGEPGAIVSFELDAAKLLRDAAGFNWDLQKHIDAGRIKVIQTSPAVLLNEFRNPDGAFADALRNMGARRLLIDGLTPMRLYAEMHDMPFREDLHLLIEGINRLGVTTLVTAERDESLGTVPAHERFVFDTIISLTREEKNRRVQRRLTVLKSRGHDFIAGSHTMRIEGGKGIHVYRRAQSRPMVSQDQPTSGQRLSTGCEAIDEMMDGGLYEGSVTMVSGISGTGKTVLSVQFLRSAIAAGHKTLLVSLDEHPRQLMRNADSLGMDMTGMIERGELFVHYESPLELELDVHFDRIVKLIEEHGIDCVVFDSCAVYEMTSPTEVADYLYAIATYCKDRLATVFFNYESPELLGLSQISQELKGSHLVDNIILLNYVEISTLLRRAIAIPKVRGSRNRQVTREYLIGEGGLSLLPEDMGANPSDAVPQLPFSSYYGLLSRSPSRQSPAIEDAVANGTKMPESIDLPTQDNP